MVDLIWKREGRGNVKRVPQVTEMSNRVNDNAIYLDLNCGAGEDSQESLGQQRDQTSQS